MAPPTSPNAVVDDALKIVARGAEKEDRAAVWWNAIAAKTAPGCAKITPKSPPRCGQVSARRGRWQRPLDIVREIIEIVGEVARGLPPGGKDDPLDDGMPGG
jgi:hypothetical protein